MSMIRVNYIRVDKIAYKSYRMILLNERKSEYMRHTLLHTIQNVFALHFARLINNVVAKGNEPPHRINRIYIVTTFTPLTIARRWRGQFYRGSKIEGVHDWQGATVILARIQRVAGAAVILRIRFYYGDTTGITIAPNGIRRDERVALCISGIGEEREESCYHE